MAGIVMRGVAMATGVLLTAGAMAQSVTMPTEAPKREKKICRGQADIGSLVERRTCRTAAEWQRLQDQDHRTYEQQRLQQQAMQGGSPQ